MFSIIHLVLLTSVLKNVYLERKVVKKIANMHSEKKAEQNVETKLDSGKQKKKENAVERSGENIRTDSAEEALPYELVIVEAEKK